MGMKGDYIRQLRIKSIRRRIEKIPKGSQLMKFSETLGKGATDFEKKIFFEQNSTLFALRINFLKYILY
jgi:hypothetical protein